MRSDESRAIKMRSSTGSISHARSAVRPPTIAMQANARAIRCACRQMKSRTSRPTSADERASVCGTDELSRIRLPPPVLEVGRDIGKAAGAGGDTPDRSRHFPGDVSSCYFCDPEVLMAKVEKITVALSEDTLSAVRDAVGSGDYANTSEVIRDALRDWRMKRRVAQMELDEMRRLVREGSESGPGIDADLVFARLRAKYR